MQGYLWGEQILHDSSDGFGSPLFLLRCQQPGADHRKRGITGAEMEAKWSLQRRSVDCYGTSEICRKDKIYDDSTALFLLTGLCCPLQVVAVRTNGVVTRSLLLFQEVYTTNATRTGNNNNKKMNFTITIAVYCWKKINLCCYMTVFGLRKTWTDTNIAFQLSHFPFVCVCRKHSSTLSTRRSSLSSFCTWQ